MFSSFKLHVLTISFPIYIFIIIAELYFERYFKIIYRSLSGKNVLLKSKINLFYPSFSKFITYS